MGCVCKYAIRHSATGDVKEWGIMGKKREINYSWGHRGDIVKRKDAKRCLIKLAKADEEDRKNVQYSSLRITFFS
jgi:hypothetical protein